MEDTHPADRDAMPGWLMGVGLLLVGVALLGSAVLIYESVTASPLPGCGETSGCGVVLASRWSKWLGLPVAAGAVPVYGVMLWGLLHGRRTGVGAVALRVSCVAAVGAALWFFALQAFVIHALCKYCSTVHAAASVASVLVLLDARRAAAPRRALRLAPLGLVPVVVLIAGQLAFPGEPVVPRGTVGAHFADTGPGPGRLITYPTTDPRVVGVQVDPRDVPILGDPDAPVVALLASDYTCAYCGLLHRAVHAMRERFGPRVAVVLLPVARDSVPEAGALRDLALAVWLIDRDAFAMLDAWLYEPEPPAYRAPAAARAYAETLVDPAALDATLGSEALRDLADRFAAVHAAVAGDRYPAFVVEHLVFTGSPVGDVGEIPAFLDRLVEATSLE